MKVCSPCNLATCVTRVTLVTQPVRVTGLHTDVTAIVTRKVSKYAGLGASGYRVTRVTPCIHSSVRWVQSRFMNLTEPMAAVDSRSESLVKREADFRADRHPDGLTAWNNRLSRAKNGSLSRSPCLARRHLTYRCPRLGNLNLQNLPVRSTGAEIMTVDTKLDIHNLKSGVPHFGSSQEAGRYIERLQQLAADWRAEHVGKCIRRPVVPGAIIRR